MSLLNAKEQELQKYELISENLENIIKQGLQEVRWIIRTNVSGLPELPKSKWLLEKLPTFLATFYNFLTTVDFPFYDMSSSSPGKYLERIFENNRFDLTSIANLSGNQFQLNYIFKGLTLIFEVNEYEKMEKRKIIFFEPVYTKKTKIEVEVEVKLSELHLKYSGFRLITEKEGMKLNELILDRIIEAGDLRHLRTRGRVIDESHLFELETGWPKYNDITGFGIDYAMQGKLFKITFDYGDKKIDWKTPCLSFVDCYLFSQKLV